MSELIGFLLAVALLLIAAKGAGYLSVLLGQPSVVGELLVGLLLGPTVLNILGVVPWFGEAEQLSESIALFAELGVIFLMFLAGLELEMGELLKSGHAATLAGTLGVIIPLVIGFGTAYMLGLSSTEAVFVGLALAATSVSISAQTLMELGVLRSKVGLALLGAAVVDDVLVVLLLSAASVLFATGGGSGSDIWIILIRMILFLIGATAIGLFVLPTLVRRVSSLPISQGLIAFALVTCLLFAWASEAVGGVAAITGSFMAGLFLARTSYANQIEEGISTIAYSFFVPIFLVNIGLQANLREINSSMWIAALVMTLVAILTKVIGSGGGALLAGFNRLSSLRLGIGMISRGEVGLIVASVALSQSLISRDTFSMVVFIIIVATLVTPVLLRMVYEVDDSEPDGKPNKARSKPAQAGGTNNI